MAQFIGIGSPVSEILSRDEKPFLEEWIRNINASTQSNGSIAQSDLRQQCLKFFGSFRAAFDAAGGSGPEDPRWKELKELLGEISKSRAVQGFTPTETATFVFSFKEPLFRRLREDMSDPQLLADQIWGSSEVLDALGLYTTEVFLRTREDLIRRAQEDMLELSTPVVKLWKGILALPLVGTLDSARTQVVMETLLEAIVETNSKVAIIDITGVPTVDTVVAQHLLKTVTAARLMGADCIISGIRPQIAQTIVHLGINLLDVTSKATLRDAFALALERTGQQLVAGNS
ncbi:MAG TPA: STAS domain-containing protein [Candidatus Aquilonibacter sp.]|nr:STAS domain-containing protein [Candidatus Aquilonibacter sp.]